VNYLALKRAIVPEAGLKAFKSVRAETPAFAKRLRDEVDALLSGDVETGKTVLRNCINATGGFDKPATVAKKLPKSLMRMLGPKGNPQARNFLRSSPI
jgi:hypothetical protein